MEQQKTLIYRESEIDEDFSVKLRCWGKYKKFVRKEWMSKGYIPTRFVNKYIEKKKSKKPNKKKKIYGQSSTVEIPEYRDDRFDDWQNTASLEIHNGKNLVLDVATSCGKTWFTNLVVGYETLVSDTKTAIFIAPNREILLDNVKELNENHSKNYTYGGSRVMVEFETSKVTTLQKSGVPKCQILCITADIVLEILCRSQMQVFLSNLRYVVCDEVHMDIVSRVMWRMTMHPGYPPQYILLSATLGNTDDVCESLIEFQPKRKIRIIKYNVRPIPLQRITLKNKIIIQEEGAVVEKGQLYEKSAFYCQTNFQDPTIRDCKKMASLLDLDIDIDIPKDREKQHKLGQLLSKRCLSNEDVMDEAKDQEQIQIEDSVREFSIEKIVIALQQLFAKNMAPVLIFNQVSIECLKLVRGLVLYLQEKELNDSDVRSAASKKKKADKQKKSKRDEPKKKKVNKKDKSSIDKLRGMSVYQSMMEEIDMQAEIDLGFSQNKWKFPSNATLKYRNIPEWIRLGLEYGIGVHLDMMNYNIKTQMFNFFRDGKIKILISDLSLAVGINLPARTVITTGAISPALYKQMGGRAGRRGKETMGYVMTMNLNIPELLDMKELPCCIQSPPLLSVIELFRFNLSKFWRNKYLCEWIKNYEINLYDDEKEILTKQKEWITVSGLLKNKYSGIVCELNDNKIFILLCCINKGLLHQSCCKKLDMQYRVDNLMIVLCYLLDDNLEINDDRYLPDLPDTYWAIADTIQGTMSWLEKPLLERGTHYDNSLLLFHKRGEYNLDTIQKIGNFQKRFFRLLNILRLIVPGDTDKIKARDPLFETFISLDKNLWAKCQQLRGSGTGL